MKRRWLVLLVGVVVFLLVAPATVLAHAELIHSEPVAGAVLPSPPTRVRLDFSEPIEPDFFAIEVYAPDGARVDRGDAHVPADSISALEASLPDLAPGAYTVSWRILSIDGHVVQETFNFTVGTRPETAPVLDLPRIGPPLELAATVRWWSFFFSFVLVGGLAFLPLIVWPAQSATGIADDATARRAARGFLWVAWPALAVLLLLSLAMLMLQASDVTGLALLDVPNSRAITRLLTRTRYGSWWMLRFGLLAGLLAIVTALAVEARPGQSRGLRLAGIALGAGVFLTFAASGHASGVVGQTTLAIAADWLHLVAGAIWVGGLLQLVLGLLPALRGLDAGARRALLAAAVRRFSVVAGLSVLLLILTGVYAGVIHVPSWTALADTLYGATLTSKLLLVLPLLLLGAINLLVLHPRFVRAARTPSDARTRRRERAAADTDPTATTTEDRSGVRTFRWLVLGEITLALLILGVTGYLTVLPPATTAPGQAAPYTTTQAAGPFQVTLAVDPNQAGDNTLTFTVADGSGQPVAGATVNVELDHNDMDMGTRQIVAAPTEAGRYAVSGNFINMAGGWNALVRIVPAGGPEASTTFQFSAGASLAEATSNAPRFSPARILYNAASPVAISGLMAFGLAALIFLRRPHWRRARDRRHAAWIGAALVFFGVFATGSVLAGAYQASLPNPVPATDASISQGRQIYTRNCAMCHGQSGRGDGPAGVMLNPRPADLRFHMTEGHSDGLLYTWISQGIDGTGMPPFEQQLSRDDIWHVVNYIRTFAPVTP